MIQLYKYEEIDGQSLKTIISTGQEIQYKSKLTLACLVDAEKNYPNANLVKTNYGYFLYDEAYDITVYYLIREVK